MDGGREAVLVGVAVTTIGEADGNIVGSNVALLTMGAIVGSTTTSVGLSVTSFGFSVSSPGVPSSFASSVVKTNSHSVFAKTPSQSLPPSLFVAVFPPPPTYCPPSIANLLDRRRIKDEISFSGICGAKPNL